MKTTALKTIIEQVMLVGSSEMTQRFQNLRKARFLPNEKGQAARDLTKDEIVNGILSVFDARPGFAFVIVKCAKSLLPVRGEKYSYKGAKDFGKAMLLMIENYNDIVELRIKGIEDDDSGIPPYAYGTRAELKYKDGDETKVAYYVPAQAVSLLGEDLEDAINYIPHQRRAPFEREYVVNREVFKRIHLRLKQENEHDKMIKEINKHGLRN